ncbi:hypothetical protein A3709_19300 [Halioglobus sp. HI00S01]|uniref:hypothetical protein n=1 Tax=Halioglobus sp. HI00S01 TaxID=1822214 RepID=UPI0007C2FE9B|nr:hypothetical protein [Halioglobus sp. HI00S01]KZX57771.1 hypothetical protein A3709_19300 [Halioglobus sp. HI00S01]
MKKETVLSLVRAVRRMDADLVESGETNHGMVCLLIDMTNGMHFAAMEYLGIAEEDAETKYDEDRYLLKATTPEACDWVTERIGGEEPSGEVMYFAEIPDIFGYGINLIDTDEDSARRRLKKAYFAWRDNSTLDMTFERAVEHFGGGVREIQVGKSYYDGFKA